MRRDEGEVFEMRGRIAIAAVLAVFAASGGTLTVAPSFEGARQSHYQGCTRAATGAAADGADHEFGYATLVVELDLRFMRVDVHIDAAGVNVQEQERCRVPSLEQFIGERLFQRIFHHLALDPAPVDEEDLHPFVVAGISRCGNKTRQAAPFFLCRLSFDGDQTPCHLGAVKREDRRLQA